MGIAHLELTDRGLVTTHDDGTVYRYPMVTDQDTYDALAAAADKDQAFQTLVRDANLAYEELLTPAPDEAVDRPFM
jgi:hypothetical protein